MNYRTDAQNSPESGATPEHDLRVGSQGAGPSGDRFAIWNDIVGMYRTLGDEIGAMFLAETPPWEALSRTELTGMQARFTGTIHRLRELRNRTEVGE